MDFDFNKYKSRLKEYLRQKNVDVTINPTHCFNTGGHKNGDANPSLQLWDNGFKCYGCGIHGDIYDAARILEGITDKKEQFNFIEKFFGGPPPSGLASREYKNSKEEERFRPDPGAVNELVNFLQKNPAGKSQVIKFLQERASCSVPGSTGYPEVAVNFLTERLYYWPGADEVRRHLSNDILKQCGIFNTWSHSGVVMRLGMGLKLHYYQRRYCDNCKRGGGGGNAKKNKGAARVRLAIS
jgi:hypothetical protein